MKAFDWRDPAFWKQDAEDRENCWMWVERDALFSTSLPPWSCYCINQYEKKYLNKENNDLFAVKGCKNCLGYGFMPIPPSEVYK